MLKGLKLAAVIFMAGLSFALGQSAEPVENEASAAPEAGFSTELLFDDPHEALSQLEALGDQVKNDQGFALYYAYADYMAGGKKSRPGARLKSALEAYERSGAPANYEYGRILTDYAEWQLARYPMQYGRETAKRAETILSQTRPDALDARAQAIIWQGVSQLNEDPLFDSHLETAFEEFARARALYEGCCADADYPQGYLIAVAWQAATAGTLASRNPRSELLDEMAIAFVLPETAEVRDLCGGDWEGETSREVRNGPDWSRHLMGRHGDGYVVSVDFAADGEASDIRVLAETLYPIKGERKNVQLRLRDKALRKAMGRWRISEGADDVCRRDRLLVLGGYARGDDRNFRGVQQMLDDVTF